ncbi:RNA polymerase sigma factor [Streptomyces chartreusis]|uniref:RNA polymerase sigma factor n=1 Tax=Streptomyces chartreusis TaxID=1969 RepID=UPI003702C395
MSLDARPAGHAVTTTSSHPQEGCNPPSPAGFTAFFVRYEPQVRRYLYARGARNDVLEESAQTTMEEALRSWKTLKEHPAPHAWLFKVAAQRHAKTYKEHLRLGDLTDPADFDHIRREDVTDSCDDRLDLLARLRELPEQQREALVLHWLLDLPHDQVAAAMGLRPSSTRAHVSRALARLMQMYAQEEGGCA